MREVGKLYRLEGVLVRNGHGLALSGAATTPCGA